MLKSKGVKVPRPNYDGAAAITANDEEGEEDEAPGGEDEEDKEAAFEPKTKTKSKLDKFKMNHEATSDEDED